MSEGARAAESEGAEGEGALGAAQGVPFSPKTPDGLPDGVGADQERSPASAAPSGGQDGAPAGTLDLWPQHVLGAKWGDDSARPDPCKQLARGKLPSLPPVLDDGGTRAGRMGRMGTARGSGDAQEEEEGEDDSESDARQLQTDAVPVPACEFCGQRGSLPLQGPLCGPYLSTPLRLPTDETRDRTLLRSGGWAHTWCLHYASSSGPIGSLAGDAPRAGSRGQMDRVAAAMRLGRRTECSVCWKKGASVACSVEGCGAKFHLGCARWCPRPSGTVRPKPATSCFAQTQGSPAPAFPRPRFCARRCIFI